MTSLPVQARRGLSGAVLAAAAVGGPPPAPPRPATEPVLTKHAVLDWSDVGVGALGGAGAALLATGGALYAVHRTADRSPVTERKPK
jgi:hypothetical protein